MKIKLYTFICLCLVSGAPLAAVADQQRLPFSYARGSDDGRYIFVMLATNTPIEKDRWVSPEITADLRSTYPSSGMYKNNSTTPLWTVDWYAYDTDIPLDGDYIVRNGPWAGEGVFDTEAVSFFKNGELIKTYRVCDLVDFPALIPPSISHFEWKKSAYVEQNYPWIYVIKTVHGETFWIDVTTGEILKSRRLPRIILIWSPIALAGVVLSIILKKLLCRRKSEGVSPAI